MMDYAKAYDKVVAFAAEGNIKGIQDVVKQAQESGMSPALVMTLGQFTEAAMLHVKPKNTRRSP